MLLAPCRPLGSDRCLYTHTCMSYAPQLIAGLGGCYATTDAGHQLLLYGAFNAFVLKKRRVKAS